MFTMLALRTDFSVGESIITTEDVIDEAKRCGQTAVAITDTMSVTSMIDFSSKAKKAGIKPIINPSDLSNSNDRSINALSASSSRCSMTMHEMTRSTDSGCCGCNR